FKYVITDFSHANFGFWMNHPRLQELFALGVVDFAVFDAEAGPGEVGGLSGEELRPGDLDNPVIVVANYVFDSLKQDAFR
ncbi:unnamed protein product, partial [Hapterophycus canaliculatus]